MAEKDTVFKGKIKQSGIFNFKEFYSYLYDYLNEDGYDVSEKSYSEQISGDSKKIEIKWEASRSVSDYFKFQIKIDWLITGMKEVDVEKEGKKTKMNSGSVELKFSGVMIKDYESRWENKPIYKFLRGVYDRYIIKSRIDEYEIKLFGEVNNIIKTCKSFLSIEGK